LPINLDSKATLMSWHIQSIECRILLKIHKWFTDNNYNVGQFCHDSLTIEHDKHTKYPDLLPKNIIDKVNNAINKIGGKYNYEGYTVTLSKKVMEIKDLGNIIVDPNVLPPLNKKKVQAKVVKEKVAKKKSDNITHGMSSSSSGDTSDFTNTAPKIVAAKSAFSKPSTHRTMINGCGHIPYKITCQDKFTKMMNDIFDQMDLANDDNLFLNEYPHHVDDVPHIYYLDFDWKLSDAAIDAITDTLAKCTKDGNYPTFCIARNEESGKVHLYVKMICKEDAKIGVLSKWRNAIWDNLENLDKPT